MGDAGKSGAWLGFLEIHRNMTEDGFVSESGKLYSLARNNTFDFDEPKLSL